jgi:RND family efflux transporter MFP subunit
MHLALGALWGAGCVDSSPGTQSSPSLAAVSVATAPVARSRLDRPVTLSGWVVPREEILVTSELTSGRIVAVRVEEGARVKGGEPLIELDTALIDAQLRQAEANRDKADAAVMQGEAALEEARALLDEARGNLRRADSVAGTGALAEETLAQRRTALRVAEARLKAAEQAARVSLADQRAAAAQALEASTRKRLSTLSAPADALVTERKARVGGSVVSAEPLLRLAKGGLLEVEAEVSESQQPLFAHGTKVDVLVGGRTLPGTVRVAGGRLTREDRLARIRVALPAETRLATGQVAEVRGRGSAEDVLSVPETAVLYDGSKAIVYVVEAGLAKRRDVRLGARAEGRVAVSEGLREGEPVVSVGAAYLRDGETVRIGAPATGKGDGK